ncbi:Protein CBG04817 [Caenorhabditis briggsae]|uniref:Protein CBG04817 n=1 Tax=Caenorhabditis briggsae TaxID=6238 RepID=A8WYJ5_CAEBR|nr:Protein CBG04817 [Caenorhabditis briggsae]CAP25453.1 Protein CBG04817 [Caenorhabditis briggsae]
MFKVFVTLSALALAVFCAPPGWPTAEEAKAEMQASGISSQAADGILKIATDFASQKPAEGVEIDREAARTAFNEFIGQVDAYIKTQSPEDQTAYQAFVSKKKAEFESRIAERKAEGQ